MAALLFLLQSSEVAHAGLFSFIEKLLVVEDDQQSFNSQTLPLLKAAQAPDPEFAMGGAVINNVVSDSSLLPAVGPLGGALSQDAYDAYRLNQISTYTVREGDTLSRIADMFGVSVNTILFANDLKRTDIIKPGDVLVILPISGIQYTVKKGDTIKSIAKKLGSDSDEIISFNDLSLDGTLEAGATIIVPNGEITPSQPPTRGVPSRGSVTRGTSGPDLGGYFRRPITAGRKTQGIHGVNGVDLADSCGTPIYASAGGDVIIAKNSGWNGGYGKYVVISHPNGTQTLYSHLSTVAVQVGWHVAQGFQIGAIGSTGNSTGCHVHFEVRGAKNPF